MVNDVKKFWGRVDIQKSNQCWPWTGPFNYKSYGVFNWEAKRYGAHRMAYYFTHNSWPNICRHTCDNPKCCNPAHLLNGTNQDNMNDMKLRGRSHRAPGEKHHNSKITDAQVMRIRERKKEGEKCKALAKEYGVCTDTIVKIIRRASWNHI